MFLHPLELYDIEFRTWCYYWGTVATRLAVYGRWPSTTCAICVGTQEKIYICHNLVYVKNVFTFAQIETFVRFIYLFQSNTTVHSRVSFYKLTLIIYSGIFMWIFLFIADYFNFPFNIIYCWGVSGITWWLTVFCKFEYDLATVVKGMFRNDLVTVAKGISPSLPEQPSSVRISFFLLMSKSGYMSEHQRCCIILAHERKGQFDIWNRFR